jgi:hypothetical protein
LKDSGLKMELFHLEAGILHLRGRKIIRTLICNREILVMTRTSSMQDS